MGNPNFVIDLGWGEGIIFTEQSKEKWKVNHKKNIRKAGITTHKWSRFTFLNELCVKYSEVSKSLSSQ